MMKMLVVRSMGRRIITTQNSCIWFSFSSLAAPSPRFPLDHTVEVEIQGTPLKPTLAVSDLEVVILASPTKAFTPENCAQSVFLMGKKRSKNAHAIDRLLSLSKDKGFSSSQLTKVVHGITMNRMLTQLPEWVLHHPTLLDLQDFSPDDLTTVLYSLAKCKQPDSELLKLMEDEVILRRDLSTFSPKPMSRLLYSFAKLEYSPASDVFLPTLIKALHARSHLVGQSRDVFHCLFGLNYYRIQDQDLLQKFSQQALTLVKWEAEDYTKVFRVLCRMDDFPQRSEFAQKLQAKLLNWTKFDFNPEDIAHLCRSFAHLDLAVHPDFVTKIAREVETHPTKFRNVHLKAIHDSQYGSPIVSRLLLASEK